MGPRAAWMVDRMIEYVAAGRSGHILLSLQDAPKGARRVVHVPQVLNWAAVHAMALDAENRDDAALRVDFLHGSNPKVRRMFRVSGPGCVAFYEEMLPEPKQVEG